jgi:hypothetical protein
MLVAFPLHKIQQTIHHIAANLDAVIVYGCKRGAAACSLWNIIIADHRKIIGDPPTDRMSGL